MSMPGTPTTGVKCSQVKWGVANWPVTVRFATLIREIHIPTALPGISAAVKSPAFSDRRRYSQEKQDFQRGRIVGLLLFTFEASVESIWTKSSPVGSPYLPD